MLRFRCGVSMADLKKDLKYFSGEQFIRLWSNFHVETNLVLNDAAKHTIESMISYDMNKQKLQIENFRKVKK